MVATDAIRRAGKSRTSANELTDVGQGDGVDGIGMCGGGADRAGIMVIAVQETIEQPASVLSVFSDASRYPVWPW